MAEKVLNTRIQLKYDTYANWSTNNPVLKSGEMAITVVPAETGAVQQEPAILIKVGDGTKNYNDLMFVSGLAGDVYAWAKAATKPSYAATEISGLAEYIAGEIQDTDTTYQVVQGATAYEWKLQSKGKEDPSWTDVSTITVPTTAASAEVVTGGTKLPTAGAVADFVTGKIAALKKEDAEVTGQFVTAVSEADGVITVTRKAPTVSDISDLVFNSTYNSSTNKAATMQDVNAALSSVLKFKGTKATEAELPQDSNVVGDVWYVTQDDTEYVWVENEGGTGRWEEFGPTVDLSGYQEKITASNKLDGNLVEGIEYGAQVNVIESITAGGQALQVTGKAVALAKIAETGNVNDLIQTEGDVLVFNCGNSQIS